MELLKLKPSYGAFILDQNNASFVTNEKGNGRVSLSLSRQDLNKALSIFQLELRNTSKTSLNVNSLVVADFFLPNYLPDKILENGWGQSSFSGYKNTLSPTKKTRLFLLRDQNPYSFLKEFGYLKGSVVNEWYTQIVKGNSSLVIGAITTSDQFTQIFVKSEGSGTRIRITCQVDGLTLQPGASFTSEKIALVTGTSSQTLEIFANLVKKENKIQDLEGKKAPFGLCCAYYFQGNKVNESYILQQLETLDKLPGKLNLDYIQIDAGYSPWGDWLDTQDQFPSGMSFIVKEIKRRGYKAGIWIAPFVTSPRSKLFNKHPDWFIKDDKGNYLEGRFTSPVDFLPFLSFRILNLTHPKVQQHIEKIIKQLVVWGFEFIKTDFTYPVCFANYDNYTRAHVLRSGLEIIRKAAGKNVRIQSGITQLSPLTGLIDYARVGLDTINPFVCGIPFVDRVINKKMLKDNLRNCRARQFLNKRVWFNDADCLICRPNTGLDEEIIKEHFEFMKDYGGSRWLGDHLGLLSWGKYEKWVLDLIGFIPDSKPAISVVVPAWNEGKIVKKLMDSLCKQETKIPFEVVFVDNNCTDNTVRIVNEYKAKIRNLRIIKETKQGIGAARRAGFSKSGARIIASTDADVRLPKDWLTRIWGKFWEKQDIIALVGNYIFCDKGRSFNRFFKSVVIFLDHLHKILKGNYAFRGIDFAIKKDYYEKSGGFNPKISALEDVELSLRVGVLGKIAYLSNLTVTTVYRRFKGRFLEQLIERSRVYLYRVILKDEDKYSNWKTIR